MKIDTSTVICLIFNIIPGLIRFGSSLTANCDEISAIRNKILKDYDKLSIPTVNRTALQVEVYMYINDMVPLDNAAMHFTIDVFLRLYWRDYRFKFNSTNVDSIPFDYQMLENIWVPNIYFLQGKNGFKHELLQQNALTTIDKDGNVIISERVSLSSYCDMDMKFYPFDIQKCDLQIESYAFNTDYMILKWDTELGVGGAKNLKTIDFSEVKFEFRNSSAAYGKLGTYSQLIINFYLHRNLGLFVLRDFIPCILIVCLSWVAFWINHKVTPARVAFGITTVLTVVTLTNSIRAQAPQSSKFRSIDYFLFFCQLFVFTALGECALIGMAKPEAYEDKKEANKRKVHEISERYVPSVIKKILSPSEMQASKSKVTKNDDITDQNNIILSKNGTNYGYEGWKSFAEETQNEREKVTQLGYNNWIGKQVETKEDTKQKYKTKWRLGRVQFHTGEAHVIDQMSRIVFPLAFLLLCLAYFAFHKIHPDTV